MLKVWELNGFKFARPPICLMNCYINNKHIVRQVVSR